MKRMGVTIACMMILLCGCSDDIVPTSTQIGSAADSFDRAQLLESLEAIKTWHSANKTGTDLALRIGLRDSALNPEFSNEKCRLTEELKLLWSWHDGDAGPGPFIWYHDFLSLEEAISEYRWLVVNPLVRWDPMYVPIMSFEGEWYGAYCGVLSDLAGPIVHFDLEDGGRLVAKNLTTFMITMAQFFETGAINWVNGGMVEDIHKVRDIHRNINPGYEFRYYVDDRS